MPAIFVAALFAVTFLRQPNGSGDNQLVLNGEAIGTTFTVKVLVPKGPHASEEEVTAAIGEVLEEVDLGMSTYRQDSELSRFNAHGTELFAASRPLLDVMEEARRISEFTGGAFDITVGPLVDAWGFGPEGTATPPDDAALDLLLEENGYGLLEIDSVEGTLRKDRSALRCDLSAIAKGYAVDLVADRLLALGFDEFMVEIGGEIRAAGRNSDRELWRIGVERPQLVRGGVWSVVKLEDTAMATSGDYRNYYERDGVRISHLIDPRTGRPITHALASVSVIHESCMTADALATALSVLGPDEGRALVEREGIAAFFLIRRPGGDFEEWASESWPKANTGVEPGVAIGGDEQ